MGHLLSLVFLRVRKGWGRWPGQGCWPWAGFSHVCVSTVTYDVIQRVAFIRGPTRHHRGRVSASCRSWNVPATKATAPSVIVRSGLGPTGRGTYSSPSHGRPKVLCLQVGYFIRAVRPEQSPVESPLPSWKTADTPPAPATLMHVLPPEAIGFGTQCVEIRPDPSPDRDEPLSAQHKLLNVAGGTQ